MTIAILRRRKLGRTSVREIVQRSVHSIVGVRNDQPMPDNLETVFRWGCTSNVPDGTNIINTAAAIHLASDKSGFRNLLQNDSEGLKLCPDTIFHPMDYDGGVVIVRPQHHHQGRHLHVCANYQAVASAYVECGREGAYISEFIDKVAEYRIFVVQGRCVCVAKKTPANADVVAWNVAQGGRFDNVRWDDWPLKAVKYGIKAFNLSGLDFGGVDVMVDRDGGVFVLEINSAPSLTSPYRQSCFAKAFDYIIEHGKEHFPEIQDRPRGGYAKFIHPAIRENA